MTSSCFLSTDQRFNGEMCCVDPPSGFAGNGKEQRCGKRKVEEERTTRQTNKAKVLLLFLLRDPQPGFGLEVQDLKNLLSSAPKGGTLLLPLN